MQNVEHLSQIKQKIVLLDENEKRNLAEFLADELEKSQPVQTTLIPSDEERQQQLEWLKTNREKFAGKFIALSGNDLVGEGETFREARERALENGYQNPFVTFVYSETDVPFGGW